MDDYSTGYFLDMIERCESTEEFKELLTFLDSERDEWKRVIAGLMEESGLSVSDMAKKCGISRQAVMKWQTGSIPKSRDMFIRIALAAGYSLEQTDQFLKKYGRCPELYAKTLEDAVYIFILSSDHIEHSYQSFLEITDELKRSMDMPAKHSLEESFETGTYMRLLTDVSSVPELAEFIAEHARVYKQQYRKLYAYIEMYIESNLLSEESARDSVYALAERQQWSASLRTCVSEIHNRKWYPQRNKIISLGIHLNMDVEQLNYMLQLAHMSELYAKNPFESSIIFALNSAALEDYVGLTGSDLIWYVKSILESLQYTDIGFFLDELPTGSEETF
ncbi:MAG: helix-turn-helix transcriptional regulator [Lachnospiraceae bacterium]|nr:helix-turn-helix transcriptional regulator [Lachnospiraceae bacterium]